MPKPSRNITFVEGLDPRTKFFVAFLLAAQTLLFSSIEAIATTSLIILLAVIASRVTMLKLIVRVRTIVWFLIIITSVNMFTVSGDILFELEGLIATKEGLALGLRLSVKIVLLLWCSLLFVWNTSIESVLEGIETVFRPLRKRFGSVTLLMSITLNFVPLLIRTAQRIKTAQIARGADIDSNFFRQVRFAFSASVPLFAAAFRSSQQLALAMEARCYDPSVERSVYSKLKMERSDWVVGAGTVSGFLFVTARSI
ncbi:MAG: energy-coupling factor transporter transmembrane component T [Ignavibacteria bacterium]|nr:energy-coupling factor transporter transmembrane component T [Ignavibacteria bacterium]